MQCATAHPDGKRRALLIGGGIANFTDVAATFSGIIRALREKVSQTCPSCFVSTDFYYSSLQDFFFDPAAFTLLRMCIVRLWPVQAIHVPPIAQKVGDRFCRAFRTAKPKGLLLRATTVAEQTQVPAAWWSYNNTASSSSHTQSAFVSMRVARQANHKLCQLCNSVAE